MAEAAIGTAMWVVEKALEKVRGKVVRVIATVNRISGSGPSSDEQEAPRPEEMSLNNYSLFQAYVLMAVTGLGYLALTWSTVVLLGGFVTSVGKKDFWCLTAISMVQAARIFNDSEDNLFPIFVELTEKFVRKVFANPVQVLQKVFRQPMSDSLMTALWVQSVLVIAQILSIPVLVAVLVAAIIYVFGPVACIVLSVWRIRQRDYGNTGQDDSKANLVPALDIFYSLVICQGALFFIWLVIHYAAIWIVASFREQCKLTEKWGRMTIVQYLSETRTKCWKDPASIKGRNFINYAVELVGSESQRDYLSGARMLDTFIKLGADVMSLLLPSRPKIQKLIDTLGWRSSDREIRELAARIIAYLAGDIHLSQFPGAIQCISTLLDTNLPYWNNQQGPNHHSPQIESKENSNVKYGLIFRVKGIEQRRKEGRRNQEEDTKKSELDSSIHDSKRDDWNELILQGLAILERLAFDQHNCRDICSTPGLLPKIMAPLYSKMLIKHINASAWADVVNGSLKVVHRLMRAPGSTGRRLRREIASSKQAVSNLEEILDQTNNASLELHIRAIEILTELAFDLHTNLSKETKENIIEKQTQIFLTDDQGKEEESATKFTELKVTAGKALVLLSGTELLSQTGSISVFIESKYNLIVQRLTEMVDARNKIIYRTTAAKILENLCSHHTMETKDMKDILLPKVLTEVLSSKGGPQNNISTLGNDAANRELSAQGTDEENQVQGHNSQIKSSSQENEEHTAMMGFQEAFLSLTLAICNKLKISAGDLDDVAQKIPHRDGEVVANLKAIVEENCDATADCLRIVKLCGEISVLMMKRSQYIPHFRDQQFVQSLSKAVKNMSNLESCILFAGTDCGAKKPVEPLLYELEEYVLKLVS